MQKMAQAESLVHGGKLLQALHVLESTAIPEDMPLEKARKHHNCGVILLQLGRPKEAIVRFLKSLKYDPTNAQAAYLVGWISAEQDCLEEALHMASVAVAIDPEFQPARRLYESLRRKMGVRQVGRAERK